MIQKICFTVILLSFLITDNFGQKKMSLEQSVLYAVENSNTIKLSDVGIKDAELLRKQAVLQRTPFVSGRGSYSLLFGRSINPTTNEFNNETFGANSFGIDASISLYNGGRINNAIKQSEIDLDAAKVSKESDINNIALMVANAYLQILQAEEQLVNAENRLKLSNEQLTRTDKLIEVGTLPANDRLDILALIATDEQAVIAAKNSIEINYLSLKQLLELPPSEEIEVVKPNLDIEIATDPNNISFSEVYNSALGSQPQIRLDELRMKSADLGIEISKSALRPSLSFFAGLSTNYSSAAKTFDPMTGTLTDIPYFDQLDNNFSQNVGLSLNVPIYSQGRNSTNVERSGLSVISAQINSDRTRQQLSSDVQNAIANARAANLNLKAAEKTFEARKRAYENAQRRFDLGAINTFELTTAQNNLNIAEVNLVTAKYDYVFGLKIIDFYMGKPLKLD